MIKIRPDQVRNIIFGTIRIVGPIATAILGLRAGVSIQKEISDESEVGIVTNKQLCKIVVKKCIPVTVAATATVVCGCMDKHFDTKNLKEMTKLYSAAAASAIVYRNKLEQVDKDAVKEADKELEEKKIAYDAKNDKEIPFLDSYEISRNKGDDLFIDILTGRQFKSNIEDVKNALVAASKEYEDSDDIEGNPAIWPARYLELNRLYELLGIKQTYFGSMFGYVGTYDKDYEDWDYCGKKIGFGLSKQDDGSYLITYDTAPIEGWYEI